MIQKRIIPVLLLYNGSLVKTINYKSFNYIGDPVNTVRIFNELQVDEIMILDILASKLFKKPDYALIKKIASECFIPLSFGGGIKAVDDVHNILSIGVEKVVINTHGAMEYTLISDSANKFGEQCIIGSVDYKIDPITGERYVFNHTNPKTNKENPFIWATRLQNSGIGELLMTSVDHEGLWNGYDESFLEEISRSLEIPVIANGGAGCLDHISELFNKTSCSAAAASSLFLYQRKGMGVLVNFPEQKELISIVK